MRAEAVMPSAGVSMNGGCSTPGADSPDCPDFLTALMGVMQQTNPEASLEGNAESAMLLTGLPMPCVFVPVSNVELTISGSGDVDGDSGIFPKGQAIATALTGSPNGQGTMDTLADSPIMPADPDNAELFDPVGSSGGHSGQEKQGNGQSGLLKIPAGILANSQNTDQDIQVSKTLGQTEIPETAGPDSQESKNTVLYSIEPMPKDAQIKSGITLSQVVEDAQTYSGQGSGEADKPKATIDSTSNQASRGSEQLWTGAVEEISTDTAGSGDSRQNQDDGYGNKSVLPGTPKVKQTEATKQTIESNKDGNVAEPVGLKKVQMVQAELHRVIQDKPSNPEIKDSVESDLQGAVESVSDVKAGRFVQGENAINPGSIHLSNITAKKFSSEIVPYILGAMKNYDSQKVTVIRLKLVPENLGEIRIKLSYAKGELTAHFYTASGLVKDALECSLPQLKETLSQYNIDLGDAGAFLGQEQQQNNSGARFAGYNLGGSTGDSGMKYPESQSGDTGANSSDTCNSESVLDLLI